MKYLLTLCYDGAGYAGFQFQKNARTVQGVLTEAASKLFGMPCDVTGCSRTDAGVHALGFCATVSPRNPELGFRLGPERVPEALNFYLPADISVFAAEEVPDAFHPRYAAKVKTYEYLTVNSRCRHPLYAGRAFMPRRVFTEEEIARMGEAAAHFVGRHDFASYMSAGSSVTDTVRTVTQAEVYQRDGLWVFRVSADGFLYNMVRIMAGTLYAVGCGRLRPGDIPAVTEARSRAAAGETLPPEGLYLCRVDYGTAAVKGGDAP